jgi:biopolymer transport protein ExbD
MSAGTGPSQDDDSGGMITEINVTPMVDIMLVLLIIFMVTASLIVSPSMKVELPKGAGAAAATKEPDIVILITRDGAIQYKGKPITADYLLAELTREHKAKPNARILIVADTKSYHGNVVKVMTVAKSVGFQRLGVAIDNSR